MLVLSRKKHETIVLNDNIELTVVEVKNNTVRLGIAAPDDVKILRGELVPFELTFTSEKEPVRARDLAPKKSKSVYRRNRKKVVGRRISDGTKRKKGSSLSDYRTRKASQNNDRAKEESVVYEVVIN